MRQTLFTRRGIEQGRPVWVLSDLSARILGVVSWAVWLASVLLPVWSAMNEMIASGRLQGHSPNTQTS